MKIERCETCRFCVLGPSDRLGDTFQCRRFPPSNATTIFPMVRPEWNCGEYVEANATLCTFRLPLNSPADSAIDRILEKEPQNAKR